MRAKTTYEDIAGELGLDPAKDERARDVLGGLVGEPDLSLLEGVFAGRKVCVFGCGPSLDEDFRRLRSDGLDDMVLVSVDGSIRIFIDEGVLPRVHVTDLDGDIPATIEANMRGVLTVVHAHGDNIERLVDVVPRLNGVVYATTQVEPTDKVLNFGGFTDGDRAVYLAEHFKAASIYLAGMGFGSVIGEYSGEYDKELKLKKLALGKRLLEELSEYSVASLFNLTSSGEDIRGFSRPGP